jgi:TniQ
LSEIKRLPITSSPKPDESFIGYITRLTEANVYRTCSWILKLAGINRSPTHVRLGFLFEDSPDFSLLAQLTGAGVAELSAMAYPPAHRDKSALVNTFFDMPVSQYVIRLSEAKVCPACLRESNYCRRLWDLAPVTVCLAHGNLLLDECPECGVRIKWNRTSVSVCHCKVDWRTLSPDPVDPFESAIAYLIHRLCGLLPSGHAMRPQSDDNPLHRLDLEHLVSALFLMAGQYRGINDVKGKHLAPSLRNSELHSLLIRAFHVFENWPDHFHDLLDWQRAQTSKGKGETGLMRDFGMFHQTLYNRLPSSQFDFIRVAFEQYLTEHWDGGHLKHRSLKRMGSLARNRKYVTKTEAMNQLNTAEKWLDSLIAEGKLKAIVRNQGKRRQFLIERASLEDLTRKFEQSLNKRETGRLLGINHHVVTDFVEKGILGLLRGPTVDGYSTWKFSGEAIAELLDRIESNISTGTSIEISDRVGFHGAASMLRRLNYRISDFVLAILDEKIRPIGRGTEEGFAAFVFSKKQVLQYLREHFKSKKGSLLTLVEASKILGMSLRTTCFLAEKGILTAKRVTDRKRAGSLISKKAIEDFDSTYLLLVQAARELNVRSQVLVEGLDARSIQLVTGNKIDQGPAYVYKKSDLKGVSLRRIAQAAKAPRKPKKKVSLD